MYKYLVIIKWFVENIEIKFWRWVKDVLKKMKKWHCTNKNTDTLV